MAFSLFGRFFTKNLPLVLSLLFAPNLFGNVNPTGEDWLRAEGNRIVDQSGRPVWITGINWFGYNTGTNALDGLWQVNLEEAITAIADRGFNLLRLPISTEIVYEWMNGIYPRPNVNFYVNPNLIGKNSLEIFDHLLKVCREQGIKVMFDNHSAHTHAMGHFYPVWYHEPITTEIFYDALVWLAERYRNDDTIIAIDLKNEPHGKPYQDAIFAIWDDSPSINNWRQVAEEAGRRILRVHPHLLIVVEGIEAFPKPGKDYTSKIENDYYSNWWGGNLRGVRDLPVDLGAHQSQLVYSPHDYGPSVHRQPWFYPGFNKETLYKDVWLDNWAYIMEENIAPLLMGEWGGFLDGGENEKWMAAMRDYIIENHLHHTFWCYNANSGDTGGLVGHDFKTWDEKKYGFLKPALWRHPSGRFVGLGQRTALGSTGMTVSEYYANSGAPPIAPIKALN